jgi:hypothetical protein
MRRVEVGGEIFEVRGLRLSEVSAAKMRKLGYGRFRFRPELKEGDDLDKQLSEIMDAALMTALGEAVYWRVDEAGGLSGLSKVWRAIVDETYGIEGEEKNSLSAGNGNAIPSESPTAPPAENPDAEPAENVLTSTAPN